MSERNRSRTGFHYYADTLHYREKDLEIWLPQLVRMNAGWLVLHAPENRAIPERFLQGLLNEGIEPVLNFQSAPASTHQDDLLSLIDLYGRWGVRYAIFFDRPNTRAAWPASEWTDNNIIDRFGDHFIPLARQAAACGMRPVLSPLYPGGSYWDTAFLRSTLELLAQRSEHEVLSSLVLGAYGWYNHHALNWGAGGPAAWSRTKPYFTPEGEQDQRGFRINEWYAQVAQTTLGRSLPVMLLEAGLPCDVEQVNYDGMRWEHQANLVMAMARLCDGELALDPDAPDEYLQPVDDNLLACCFYQLADESDEPKSQFSWFRNYEPVLPVARDYLARVDHQTPAVSHPVQPQPQAASQTESAPAVAHAEGSRKISHYLLLPLSEFGIADWQLDVVRPFIKKYQPTVGFSLEEAALADRVTVIGSSGSFTAEQLDVLRAKGCQVEEVIGDGISIATQMAER